MTIYDSYLAVRESDWLCWVPAILILFGACFTVCFSMIALTSRDRADRRAWGIMDFVAGSITLLSIFWFCAFTPRYQVYKAVITDIAALPEILEKYEIVAQDGQILTLQAWEAYDFSEDEP